MAKELFKLRVIESFKAKKLSSNGKSVLYKPFSVGNTLTAYMDNGSSTPNNYIRVFKTPDGFIIPLIYVQVLGPVGGAKKEKMSKFSGIQEAQVINDKDYYDPNQVKQAGSLISSTTSNKMLESLKKRSKAGTNGALIGAGLGFIYAVAKQKNKWVLITVGAVGGYILGNSLVNLVKDDNKKQI